MDSYLNSCHTGLLDTGQSEPVSFDAPSHEEHPLDVPNVPNVVVNFPPKALSSQPQQKRMSITLPMDIAAMLVELAESQGISQNEAIKKAIGTEWYFRSESKNGSKILLRTSDKEIREIVLR